MNLYLCALLDSLSEIWASDGNPENGKIYCLKRVLSRIWGMGLFKFIQTVKIRAQMMSRHQIRSYIPRFLADVRLVVLVCLLIVYFRVIQYWFEKNTSLLMPSNTPNMRRTTN